MQTYPPGTRIGQYEIASLPMMGGMGVVYFALDHGNDGRPVALKTFRPELLPDRAARDRFLREGTAWIELGSHPHIVRCYKVEYIDPTAFLVLELIAKEQNMPDASLRSWLIPGRPLPLEQALLFALQIARGMQHATEKISGFVHRDLKPENILVGTDKLPGTDINRLRVTDFGLVKTIADSNMSETTSNAEEMKPNQIQFTRGVGTPLYMAPEQWKGEPVGVFTDVYAFGCILYEMLTGYFATKGETIPELQVSHCEGKLQPLPQNLPKDIAELLARCWECNSSQRYQKWGILIDSIERAYSKHIKVATPHPNDLDEQNLNDRIIDEGWSYIAMGVAYAQIGSTETAVNYFKHALAISQAQAAQELQGAALNNLGLTFNKLGDMQQAIDYQKQYLAIAREKGYRSSEASALLNLGSTYLSSGQARQAINYYEQSLKLNHEISNRHDASNALGGLGNAYLNLGDAHRAISYYEQWLSANQEIGDQRNEGYALGNLGNANESLGNIDQAIDYYERALLIHHRIANLEGIAFYSHNLAVLYARQGYIARALSLAQEAATDFSCVGYLEYAQQTQLLVLELLLSEVLVSEVLGTDAPTQLIFLWPARYRLLFQLSETQIVSEPWKCWFPNLRG